MNFLYLDVPLLRGELVLQLLHHGVELRVAAHQVLVDFPEPVREKSPSLSLGVSYKVKLIPVVF